MELPFSEAEFLRVFAEYNQAVWPLQIILYAIAASLLFLAVRKRPYSAKMISAALAVLWLWMGVVYHLAFFTAINRAAFAFGALFILQAILFFDAGIRKSALSFRFRPDLYGFSGAILVIYSLVVYPLVGEFLGRSYPAAPTFGLPCPTTIFTIGMLLWAEVKIPFRLMGIPLAWSVVGSVAAVSLGITEDSVLAAAGLIGALRVINR